MNSGDKVVMCFTPGLDSFLAHNILRRTYDMQDIEKVYVDLNTPYSDSEIKFLKKNMEDINILNILDLSKLAYREDAYIPNRNLLITTLINSHYPDHTHISLNGVLDDRVSDNNKKFYKASSKILSLSNDKKIKVFSPLIKKEKSIWLKEYSHSHDMKHFWSKVYSCYKPLKNNRKINIKYKDKDYEYSTNECLACPACFRKNCALHSVGIMIKFNDKKIVKDYYNNRNIYTIHRIITIESYYRYLMK